MSSWRSISPITSDEEYWTDDSTEDSSSESDTDTEEAISNPQPTVVTTSNLQSTGEDSECEHQPASITFYRICGDNIDKSVKHRYMRSDFQGSSSLHYFHSYATADRIDFSKLSDKSPPAKQLGNHAEAFILLPSLEDEDALRENIKILISRVLYDHLPYFKVTFDGIITWHIKHCYYDEMSKKSNTVSACIVVIHSYLLFIPQ